MSHRGWFWSPEIFGNLEALRIFNLRKSLCVGRSAENSWRCLCGDATFPSRPFLEKKKKSLGLCSQGIRAKTTFIFSLLFSGLARH